VCGLVSIVHFRNQLSSGHVFLDADDVVNLLLYLYDCGAVIRCTKSRDTFSCVVVVGVNRKRVKVFFLILCRIA